MLCLASFGHTFKANFSELCETKQRKKKKKQAYNMGKAKQGTTKRNFKFTIKNENTWRDRCRIFNLRNQGLTIGTCVGRCSRRGSNRNHFSSAYSKDWVTKWTSASNQDILEQASKHFGFNFEPVRSWGRPKKIEQETIEKEPEEEPEEEPLEEEKDETKEEKQVEKPAEEKQAEKPAEEEKHVEILVKEEKQEEIPVKEEKQQEIQQIMEILVLGDIPPAPQQDILMPALEPMEDISPEQQDILMPEVMQEPEATEPKELTKMEKNKKNHKCTNYVRGLFDPMKKKKL